MVESTYKSSAQKMKPIPIGTDHLNFKHQVEIMNQLEPNEHIVFSCHVLKYNRFGMRQERNLLLTTTQLANVKGTEFQRRIKIGKMKALSKSTQLGNSEFVVHVKDEYDYRFVCEKREELFEQLKACYFSITNANLPIYGVPSKLKDIATSKKDIKSGNERMPPEQYRLREEDLYEPVTAESSKQSLSTASSDSEEEFMPKNPSAHRATFAKKGDTQVTLQDFQIKKVIGRGSFGKVFLVQKSGSKEVYAMKSLRKDVILEYDQVESTKLEKDILLEADHPFLVGMSYVFQTPEKIFFVMRFVRGGELFMHLRNAQRFSEDRARFYSIQVCMAIGYLHEKKIIYRDLKPENILMDEDGYICLTDFGLAKILDSGQQAYSFCGTPDYLAPEILHEKGHSFPVDWWAVGILTYEMIVGFPPFYTGNNNNSKMYELIKKKPVYFPDPQRHQIQMSKECQDFISQLLQKDPSKRLGTKAGLKEVLAHPWFDCLDKDKILKKQIEAPMKPQLSKDVCDVQNFDPAFTGEEAIISVVAQKKVAQVNKQKEKFENF